MPADSEVRDVVHSPPHQPNPQQTEILDIKPRKNKPLLAPINTFPPELMTHIFQLVLASEPCNLKLFASVDTGQETESSDSSPIDIENLLMYPECLTQVCTHWRHVALSSPTLWSHIDFTPHPSNNMRSLARAKLHVERAKSLPLVLHFHEDKSVDYDTASFEAFVTSIANRITSLDFTIIEYWGPFTRSVFEALLPGCVSGLAKFTHLTVAFIEQDPAYPSYFISAREHKNRNHGGILLSLPDSVVEDGFRSVSTLRLRGLFPLWSSVAYHNLIDLRLIAASNANWQRIPEAAFQSILESNPRLRVLHFALEIVSRGPYNGSISPVYLEDLEVVNIATSRDYMVSVLEPKDVLRLLAPGSKPLQLSIWYDAVYDPDCLSTIELKRFFERANVTKFYSASWCPPLHVLFSYASHLRYLVINCDSFEFDPAKSSFGGSLPTANPSLFILHDWSWEEPENMKLFLQLYPVKAITLLNCDELPRQGEGAWWKNYPAIRSLSWDDGERMSDAYGDWDIFSVGCCAVVNFQD